MLINLRSIVFSFSLLFFTFRSLPISFALCPFSSIYPNLPSLFPTFSLSSYLLYLFLFIFLLSPLPVFLSPSLSNKHVYIYFFSFSSNLSLTLFLIFSSPLFTPSLFRFSFSLPFKVLAFFYLLFYLSLSHLIYHTHTYARSFSHIQTTNRLLPLTSSLFFTHSSHLSVSFPFSHSLSHQCLLYFFPLSLSFSSNL